MLASNSQTDRDNLELMCVNLDMRTSSEYIARMRVGPLLDARITMPDSTVLFNLPDVPKDVDNLFHKHVSKILYFAKRARVECLSAVTFLSSRVASYT